MEGKEKPLTEIFAINSSFTIPLYQRNYDWKEEHCEQLFNDLLKLHYAGRENHFFGSIVSRQESLTNQNLFIIDGQQRITTISLLLIALYKLAQKNEIKFKSEITKQKIYERYLVDKFSETRKIKLKPIKNDMLAFDNLISEDEANYVKDSNVTRNFMLFSKWIKENNLYLEDYVSAIEKLVIIDIKLSEKDDPQLIFESLNSTGKDLEESDKIRNYLLMSLDPKTQEEYYEKYWNKIEEYTDYKPTMFIRDYLTIKLKRICRIDNLYKEFKKYSEVQNINRLSLLTDMLEYAELYDIVTNEKASDVLLNIKFKHLNTVGVSTGMPFYLAFLKFSKENSVIASEQVKVFDTIENYLARRIICNLPTNALNKAFCTLHSDILKFIDKNKKTLSDYLEVMKYVLLKKTGTGEFPNDNTLKEEFKTRQIYRIPLEYRYFLFERMENGNEKGTYVNDIPKAMQDGSISIEHIMPQTLNPQWRQALGENAEAIHDIYLHTFANLTLTGYNSNYGNRPFSEKKAGYTDKDGNKVIGFNDSQYYLTESVKKHDQWTESEILERQVELTNRFLDIWPMIKTDIKEQPSDNISFDGDDFDILTSRFITAFSFDGETYKVETSKDMLVEICKILYKKHEYSMIQLCHKDYYVHAKDKSQDYSKFAENCFVWTSCSNKDKLKCLKYLFDNIGITPEVEFELKPLNND